MIAAKLQVCFLAPEEVLAREGEKGDKLWFMGKGRTRGLGGRIGHDRTGMTGITAGHCL